MSAPESKVYVAVCPVGQGIFAAVPLRKGEIIFRFTGNVITLEEVVAKGDRQSNPIQIGPQSYLDVESPGVYINHSCEPNAGIVDDVNLVALQDIRKDEEICFDYSTSMSENLWTMECKCRATHCRGIIKDFHYLPPQLKTTYLKLGMVQNFIVEECLKSLRSLDGTSFGDWREDLDTSDAA